MFGVVNISNKVYVTFHLMRYSERLREAWVECGLGWLGSVVVGRRTSDRTIASSTPGRCIAR